MSELKLDPLPRRENTREKPYFTDVIKFDLDQIKQHFDETVTIIKNQFDVAEQLINEGRTDEAEYIWRTQIVILVGAFDFYLHELTKYILCEIYDGNWNESEQFKNHKVEVTFDFLKTSMLSHDTPDRFLDCVNEIYHDVTMVSPGYLKSHLKLLDIKWNDLADKAFYDRNSTEPTKKKLERRLAELFYRRNIIAHQTDRSHLDAAVKGITKDIVEDFIKDTEKIVCAIDELCRMKNQAQTGQVQ